jgi:outer membrane murein-binding lipoprotein Lpp
MSKEGFNWKGLFVNDDATNVKEDSKSVQNQSQPSTTFPTEINQAGVAYSANNHYLDEIIEVYDKGFESLNLADFDFFEMYKSVCAVGISNPQSYHMAFAMGKTLKSDLSKEFLLDKAQFYIAEIEKVYIKYDSTGKAKKNELEMDITRNKVNLSKQISDLATKIEELQADLGNEFSEIQLKMEANNFAKQKVLDSINIVVSGINQYL